MTLPQQTVNQLLDELRRTSADTATATNKRDWLILMARERNVPLTQLSDITGLSRQTCSNIAWRERGSLDG
jgi:hypothetical protein